MEPDCHLLTVAEAAQILRCSKVTLYARVKEGVLTLRKIGRRSFVLKGELDAFLRDLPKATLRTS